MRTVKNAKTAAKAIKNDCRAPVRHSFVRQSFVRQPFVRHSYVRQGRLLDKFVC